MRWYLWLLSATMAAGCETVRTAAEEPERPFTEGGSRVVEESKLGVAKPPATPVVGTRPGGPTAPVTDPDARAYLRQMRKGRDETVSKPLEKLVAGMKPPELTPQQRNRKKALLSEAARLMKEKRFGEALPLTEEALHIDPWDEDALRKHAECEKGVGVRLRLPNITVKPLKPGEKAARKGTNGRPAAPKGVGGDLARSFAEAEKLLEAGELRKAQAAFIAVMEAASWSKDPQAADYWRMAKERAKEIDRKLSEEQPEKKKNKDDATPKKTSDDRPSPSEEHTR